MAYVQDILSLCHKADAGMADSERISHIFKGIADDAFQLLVFKDCSTVETLLKECRRFEEVKKRRITSNFTRLPNTTATSTCEETPTSETQIAKIVRRELEAMLPPNAFSHSAAEPEPISISTVQAVIRQEIDKLHVPAPTRRAWASSDRPAYTAANLEGQAPRRDPAAWRTPDNKPICFHCSAVGHIARYCRSRWNNRPRTFSSLSYRRFFDDRFSPPPPPVHPQDEGFGSRPLYHHSSSPRRRQSLSPAPRRPISPARAPRSSEN